MGAISGVSFLGMHAKRSKMEWIVLFFLFDHIALAKLLLVETDEEQLNRLFDQNGDGFITKKEFDFIFKRFDLDEDGKLDGGEFAAMIQSHRPEPAKEFIDASKIWDVNNKFDCGLSPDLSLELDLKTFVQAFGFRQSSVTEEPPQNMIGGLEAKPHVFPWIVRMCKPHKSKPGGLLCYCGGALITSQHVLTAFHCVDDRDL